MHLVGAPRRPEIDQYTIKFLIGAIAFSLPWIELALTGGSITSISASFWFDPGPWPRDVFVGSLFAISAFMVAYNGLSELEMWLAKVASLAALGIALFPCQCGDVAREIIPRVHLFSAAALFAVLACFCIIFFRRARAKGHRQANWRAVIYSVTGVGMLVSMSLFAYYYAVSRSEQLVLWGETLGLVSFGVAWLTASRVIPGITSRSERERLFVQSGEHAVASNGRVERADQAAATEGS